MHIGGFGHMGTYIDLMYLYVSSPLTPFSIEICFMKKKVSFFIMILLCAAALLANKKLFAYSLIITLVCTRGCVANRACIRYG